MRVLVACEFSGIIRDAFIARGHEAWSCDLLPTEKLVIAGYGFGGHVQSNALELLTDTMGWDLLIAHPPCTYLTVAANKWMKPEYAHRFPSRLQHREYAVWFFMQFINAPIARVAVENPIGVMSTHYRKPDQIVQPFQFGHPDRKPTCLWLKGLSKLMATNVVVPNIKRNRNGKTASVHHDAALSLPADERWKARSRTYQGIADAMAEQWGGAPC